jgi:hypothetical protein
MIRRVFWLTVGAAGGIMGYRRVAALGQRISGNGTARRRSLSRGGTIRATRAVREFSQDVREGMELYLFGSPFAPGRLYPSSKRQRRNVKDDR